MNESTPATQPNGALWAAILASGIGGFAVGLVVILNEAGIFAAPSLYGPAGGVSGRTTIAALIWLLAWGVLHGRWRNRDVDGRRITGISLVLVLLGLLGTFPPVWAVFLRARVPISAGSGDYAHCG
jgi:hypothetical protein